MNWKYLFLVISLLTIQPFGYGQKTSALNHTEEKSIKVFKEFNTYIKNCIKNDIDVTSNTSVKYILLNYLFIDRQLDSTNTTFLDTINFSIKELDIFKKEFQDYLRFFLERDDKTLIDNVGITPLRLRSDKFIYDQMTEFQKANTFVLFDKRKPKKVLAYILFIPPIKDKIKDPRIWSWKLGFKFGKFYFTSPIGEEGFEYLFP